MQLKCLKLQGFKSFGKETEISFPSGTAAIVGPNGCGKSNIVDAIRWVLGEQSPRRLRGKTMEEILFSGSEALPAANMARVALTLCQRDRGFPHPFSDFAELCVERIFYRSGESEYRINRMPVRLKDIVDLFTDTGTGTRTYSIIEQGLISEIISGGPEQRRLYIEEAAGIVKYKRRKNAAVRKIEATQENLRHIEAILAEIRRQMNALNRQAQKARRYRRLKDEVRKLETTLAVREHRRLADEEAKDRCEAEVVEQEAVRLVAELNREEATAERIRADLLEENREAEQRQARLLACVQEISEIENKQIYARQRHEDLTRRRHEHMERMKRASGQYAEADQERTRLARKIRELGERERWIGEMLGEEKVRLEEALGREKGLQERIDSEKESLFACMTKRAELRNRMLSTQDRKQEAKRRRVIESEELEALRSSSEDARSEAERVENSLREWRRKRGLCVLERAVLEVQHREWAERLDALSEEIDTLQQELNGHRSRVLSLRELQENYEGYQEGVRAIMRRRKEEETLQRGIRGMVAEVVETEPEYEAALEAVLGDRLQYVIVEEQTYGVQAITYLKEQTLGRGSFIPLTPRGNARRVDQGNLDAGVPLMSVVRAKEEYQELVQHLLADVVLVPDLETGLDLWRKNGHLNRIVSREGDLIDPDGVISGGRTNGSGGVLLKTRREIRELEEAVQALGEQLAVKRGLADELSRKRRFSEADLERIQQELYEIDMEVLRCEKDLQQLSERTERNRLRSDVLASEISSMDEEIEELERLEEDLARAQERCEEQQALREATLANLGRQMQEAIADRELAQEEVSRLEIEGKLLREKRSALLEYDRRVRERMEGLEKDLVEMELASSEARERIQALEEEMKHNDLRRGELEGARSMLEEGLDRIRARVRESSALLHHKEEAVRTLKKALEEARQRQDAIKLRLVEIELKKKNVEDQLWEKCQVDVEATGDIELSDEEDEQIRQKLEKLHASIERIGEVNPTAIEEFEELQKRYDFYQQQFDDLRNSLESLRRLIQRIRRVTKARFLEAFDQINRGFQKIFPELFQGGKALLQLEDPSDPLEAGIEMVAQPPGKKLQNINLLSGGEKSLAALALVIAIFQYKPSPFCVLDEVDAALDDVNVLRFAEIIKGISHKSQFILITHNKQTMGIADHLYGITMESAGVSQLVSVRID